MRRMAADGEGKPERKEITWTVLQGIKDGQKKVMEQAVEVDGASETWIKKVRDGQKARDERRNLGVDGKNQRCMDQQEMYIVQRKLEMGKVSYRDVKRKLPMDIESQIQIIDADSQGRLEKAGRNEESYGQMKLGVNGESQMWIEKAWEGRRKVAMDLGMRPKIQKYIRESNES